jgi:predicted glycogen debranching enzyme
MESVRTIPISDDAEARREDLISREWLVTNGLGGYASGTLGGVPTRRYHGLLTAALPNPLGRTVMLTEMAESIEIDGETFHLTGEERTGRELHLPGVDHLDEVRLEMGLPVWRYVIGGTVIERRVLMIHQQNTAHVSYALLESPAPVRLRLRPAVGFRAHEHPVSTPAWTDYRLAAREDGLEITGDPKFPPLRMRVEGVEAGFTIRGDRIQERIYRVEEHRGYASTGELWSPGWFDAEMEPGETLTVIASAEEWKSIRALDPGAAADAERSRRERLISRASPSAQTGAAAELVLAADAFVVTPAYRAEDVARAHAAGEEMRTVIAGYHWFADWGRDTMIALEGLTLCTGRPHEAASVLLAFARYTRDGLIPNLFPEGRSEGLYHTADASLWFFHAVNRYHRVTGDDATLEAVLPTLRSIVDAHIEGTRFGIRVDPADGLLSQGEDGYQLTWMDAKVDDWVVTPRRGKAVELNALWYNALRLLAEWERAAGATEKADALESRAASTRAAFNTRFWNEPAGHLFDVIDVPGGGEDDAMRPNQVFAISLDHPVLDEERREAVVQAVRDQLLTPFGLRSLSPRSPDYRANYHGDLRNRDGAYHQGTVWGWLIGPYVDAWLRVYPRDAAALRSELRPLERHLNEFGIGNIAEIFDAEPPFTPRGCIAQAWSVAELLRSIVRLEREVE